MKNMKNKTHYVDLTVDPHQPDPYEVEYLLVTLINPTLIKSSTYS